MGLSLLPFCFPSTDNARKDLRILIYVVACADKVFYSVSTLQLLTFPFGCICVCDHSSAHTAIWSMESCPSIMYKVKRPYQDQFSISTLLSGIAFGLPYFLSGFSSPFPGIELGGENLLWD